MTDDLERIDEQLRRLRLSGFDETDAWELGSDLRRRAAARGVAVTIEIRIAGSTVFMCAMPGTSPANADWARRKRNVVELLHRPSYAVGLEETRDGRSVLTQMGLADQRFRITRWQFPDHRRRSRLHRCGDGVRTPPARRSRTRRRGAGRSLRRRGRRRPSRLSDVASECSEPWPPDHLAMSERTEGWTSRSSHDGCSAGRGHRCPTVGRWAEVHHRQVETFAERVLIPSDRR